MRQHYKNYRDDEKKRLIMEYHKSGLSYYQWCRENDINSSTFYNWVKKLRDAACQEALIESMPSHQVTPLKQKVVKVNILPNDELTSVVNLSKPATGTELPSIELNLNGCIIKIYNNAEPELLAHTINLLW